MMEVGVLSEENSRTKAVEPDEQKIEEQKAVSNGNQGIRLTMFFSGVHYAR